MKQKFICILSCFFLFFITSFSEESHKMVKGYLDISNVDLSKVKSIDVIGEAEFYWNKLLTPEDFKKNEESPDFYIKMPGFWNEYSLNGKKLPAEGYGTYRFKINVGKERNIGLRIPNADSNYVLWINGKIAAADGTVGKDKKSSLPHNEKKTIYFTIDCNELDVVMQISNFNYSHGGYWSFMTIGTAENIQFLGNSMLALDLFWFGCLIMMGGYHLGLFFQRKKDYTLLIFGLICIFVAMRTITTGEDYFAKVINYNTVAAWEASFKLNFLSIHLVPGMIIIFFYLLYPKEVNRKILYVSSGLTIFWVFTVMLLPAKIYFIVFLNFFQFVILAQGFYFLYVILIAFNRKRSGALIFFVGMLFMFITGVNDILLSNSLINSVYLTTLGMMVFIFSQSYYLSYKFSLAYTENEKMRGMLEESNKTLEEKVYMRTLELKENMEKLKLMQENLIITEKIASVGKLAGGIAHELNSPLGAILTSVQLMKMDLDEIENAVLRNDYTESVETVEAAANKSKDIILKLLSQVEKNITKFEVVRLNEVIDTVYRIFEAELTSKNIKMVLKLEKNMRIIGNFEDLVKAVSNLVNNSKESLEKKQSDKKIISINSYSENEKIILEIEDNGVGICDDIKNKVFDPFFTTKDIGEGLGLGATVSYDILKKHNADIFVKSTENESAIIIIEFKEITN